MHHWSSWCCHEPLPSLVPAMLWDQVFSKVLTLLRFPWCQHSHLSSEVEEGLRWVLMPRRLLSAYWEAGQDWQKRLSPKCRSLLLGHLYQKDVLRCYNRTPLGSSGRGWSGSTWGLTSTSICTQLQDKRSLWFRAYKGQVQGLWPLGKSLLLRSSASPSLMWMNLKT